MLETVMALFHLLNLLGLDRPALPPCTYEDGPAPCHWDAQARGNGQGDSFSLYLKDGSEWETCLVYDDPSVPLPDPSWAC